MSINSNQNTFFKNMPEDILHETLPTMRNMITMIDNRELGNKQDERENEVDSNVIFTPVY